LYKEGEADSFSLFNTLGAFQKWECNGIRIRENERLN